MTSIRVARLLSAGAESSWASTSGVRGWVGAPIKAVVEMLERSVVVLTGVDGNDRGVGI